MQSEAAWALIATISGLRHPATIVEGTESQIPIPILAHQTTMETALATVVAL